MLWSRAVMDVADARTVKTKASKKRPTSTHVWLDKNHAAGGCFITLKLYTAKVLNVSFQLPG